MRKTTTLIITIISVFLVGKVSAALTQKPVCAGEKTVKANRQPNRFAGFFYGFFAVLLIVQVVMVDGVYSESSSFMESSLADSSTNTTNLGLIAYYPFDGDLSDSSSNNYHGNAQGVIPFVPGVVGQAASFSGSTWMFVDNPLLPAGNSPRSLCLWAKSADGMKSRHADHIANWGTATTGQAYGLMIYLSDNWMGYGHAFQYYDLDSGIKADTNWHFLCVTYDGAKMQVYVDGIFRNERTVNLNTIGKTLYVGNRPDRRSDTTYDGLVDEIRIYDRAISGQDVQDLFKQYANLSQLPIGSVQSVSVPPLEQYYYEIDVQADQNLLVSLDQGAGLHAAISYGQLPTVYDHDFIATSAASNSRLEIRVEPTIAGKYYLLVYAPYLSSGSIDVDIRADYVTNSDLIAYYPFDGDSKDLSGNNYHGNTQGIVPFVPGIVGQAASFSGSTWMFVDNTLLPLGNSPRSLCLWAKSADGIRNGNADHIANWGTATTGQAYGLMIFINDNWWGYGDNYQLYDVDSGIKADTNWHFLCVTYDGIKMQVYVDGIFHNERTLNLSTVGSTLYVGVRPDRSSDNTYNGLVDEVRIYGRAISGQFIQDLFKQYVNLNQLPVGSVQSVTVSPLAYHYYEIDVQAGQNLLVSLDQGAGLHAAVSYGQLPTAYNYDFIAKSSSSDSSLEIPIAPTIAGKYYLLVYAPYLSSGSIDVDIRADYVDLHLSSISPNQAGNAGNFTAEIKGTGLAQDTEVTLISPSGHRISGQGQILALDTTLFSTFVLTGAETGAYDLEIKRPSDGATASIQDAVQVNQGTGGRLKVWLEGPDVVRPGRTYQYNLVYENVGDGDILAPFLTVSASDPDTVLYADNYNTNNTITWLASGDNGLSGYVLSPGHGGKIPFMVSTNNRVELKASLLKEDDTPFDWSEIERGLRPAGIADAEWNTFWNKTKQEIGSTNSEVLNMLRVANVYHGSSSKFGDLLEYAMFLVHQAPIVSTAEELISTLYTLENDVKLIHEGNFDATHGTIVLTHGWNGWEDEPRFKHFAATLKSQYPLSNVVRVIWQQGATSPPGCDQVQPTFPGLAIPPITDPTPIFGNANCASLVAKNIEPAAKKAVEQLNALGYSRWKDTIYIGESFGNGINAYMSITAKQKGYSTKTGRALMLNSARPIAYSRVRMPDFKGWFSESTAIQTWDGADDRNTDLGSFTILYVYPDCGGRPCNISGESHWSAIRLIDCLLGDRTHPNPGCGNIGENPYLAKLLIENRIDEKGLTAYQNYYDGQIHPDGSLDILKNFIYLPALGEIGKLPLYVREINPVRPIDPNDKVGPDGLGALQVVSSNSTLDYTINFENLSSATAPVQELVVIDDLDSNLDWSTLQFSAISYGDRVIPIPTGEGVLEFEMQDLPPSDVVVGTAQGDLATDIKMKLNIQTGRIEWRLKVIDTATGDFPADPLAGFLPPEDGTGRGQGYVSFSIKPKADIAEGTQITNEASITFDTNAPIQTNQVRNTVGTAADLVLLMDQTPEPFVVAQPLTYTFTVINDGPDPATNVLLTDTLPGTVTLASAYAGQGTCSQASPVVCNLGTMAKDGRTTVTIVVTPTMNGTLHNTATVTSTIIELNDLDNSAAATIAGMPDTGVYLPLIVRE